MTKNAQTIKDTEKKFWDYKYEHEQIKYNPERDFYFHDHFKKPMLDLPKPAQILEIACGVRTDGIELARAGHDLTELDISEKAVEKTRALFESQNLSGKFVVSDAENLPFADAEFDAVFTAASFHHFPNFVKALQEMKRVCKPNGYIILGCEPNAWPYYSLYLILRPLQWLVRRLNPRPFNSLADDQCWGFTKRRFKKLFRKAGIEVVKIQRVKYFQECYEQWLRLRSRLFKNKVETIHELSLQNQKFIKKLAHLDQIIAKIPILNLGNWFWNVIGKNVSS